MRSIVRPTRSPERWRKRRIDQMMLWANRNGFYYTLDRETGEMPRARVVMLAAVNHRSRAISRSA